MKRIITKICVAFVAMVLPSAASAQRTAQGEMGAYVSYTHPFMDGWGVSAGWNYYTLYGAWDVSAVATIRAFTFEDRLDVPARHYTARAGYLARVAATRDRRLNLYVGGGVLLGAGTFRLLDCLDSVEEEYGVTLSTTTLGGNPYFIFGLYPKVEGEFFFTDSVALDVSVQMPITFHDSSHSSVQKLTKVLYPEVSAGVKFNF